MSKCYICGQSGEMRVLDDLNFILCDEHYQDFQLYFLYTCGGQDKERVWAEMKKDILTNKLKSTDTNDINFSMVKHAVEDCYDYYFCIQDKIVHWLKAERQKYEGNLPTKIGFSARAKNDS